MAAALVQTPTQPSFNIEEFLAAEESKGLLRLTTAGSVDDGKSTLIGRLLHDAKGAYEDQLKSAVRGGADRFFAADRRAARGTRAGHHHRRRVSLFRDHQAQVHPGRHARPRAVHAQHGDRRFDRRAGHHSAGRASRADHAIAPARVHRDAAGHSEFRDRGEQDGPGRVRPGSFQPHPRGVRAVPGAHRHQEFLLPSLERAEGRQRGRPRLAHALVRRPVPAGVSGNRGARRPHDPGAVPHGGAARGPAGSELSRVCGADRARGPSGRATKCRRCLRAGARK